MIHNGLELLLRPSFHLKIRINIFADVFAHTFHGFPFRIVVRAVMETIRYWNGIVMLNELLTSVHEGYRRQNHIVLAKVNGIQGISNSKG